jgi:hypothetical protein
MQKSAETLLSQLVTNKIATSDVTDYGGERAYTRLCHLSNLFLFFKYYHKWCNKVL